MEIKLYPRICIEASAGSGKTYNLAKRFIHILSIRSKKCINQPINIKPPEELNSILAITFTNKAACEMKERIILFLKMLSGIYGKNWLDRDEFGLTQVQALDLLVEIIKNQSDFNVSTIDSFINKLLKAFSVDLGINPDYDISFDSKKIFELAINELILDKTTWDKLLILLKSLLTLDESGINGEKILSRVLWRFKDLDVPSQIITYNELFDILKYELNLNKKDFTYIKKTIEDKIKFYSSKIDNIIQNNDQIFYKNRIKKFKNITLKDLENNNLLQHIKDIIHRSSISFLCKKEINGTVEQNFIETIKTIYKIYSYYILFKNLYETESILKILKYLLLKEKEIKFHLNIVDGSKISKDVSNILSKEEGVTYAFCNLGERLAHYLIDEFQDTSKEQFNAIYPLIENSLSEGGSLFVVGDRKQAIYGWRGGDYTIFDELLEKKHLEIYGQNIVKNYRSKVNIVEFNNKIFNKIKQLLDTERFLSLFKENQAFLKSVQEEINKVYKNVAQEGTKDKDGYIKVMLKEFDDNEEKEEFYRSNLINILKHLFDAYGINPSDIMILLRKKEDIKRIVKWVREDIPYLKFITEDTLTLINNFDIKKILLLASAIIYHHDISYVQALEEFGIKLDYEAIRNRTRSLSPYEFFSYLVGLDLFDYKLNNCYLAVFLEKILELSNAKMSIEEIIDYFNQNEDITVDMPEDIEAVKIMTIHKAKGLESPTVIIPFYDWKIYDPTRIDIYDILNIKEICGKDIFMFGKINKSLRHVLSEAENLYIKNLRAKFVEAINLMYVANTRAKENLFILGGYKKTKKGNYSKTDLNSSVFLSEALGKELKEKEKGLKIYENGTKQTLKRQKKGIAEEGKTHYMAKLTSSIRVHLKLPSESHETGIELHDKYFGELYHLTMSFIGEITEDNKIKDKIIISAYEKATNIIGYRNEYVLNATRQTLKDLKEYFQGIEKWWNEKELVNAEGTIIRIDRLVKKDGKFFVIEYKTGHFSPMHIKQVKKYLSFFKKAQGLLYYVQTKEMINVS